MSGETGVDVLDEPVLPALHDSFDASSAAFQGRFLRLTRMSLIATVLAAAAAAVSFESGHDWPAVVALLALLAAGGARLVLLQDHPERAWYDARAGAESVKTLAWQYAVGGGPFRLSEDEPEVRRHLLDRFGRLVAEDRGLPQAPDPEKHAITHWMLGLRAAPLQRRRDIYLRRRILDQIAWYGSSAKRNDAAARRWALATVGIQAVGMAAAVLRVTDSLHFDLISIAAASAAATTAWLESKDHSGLAEAYARTAHELALVRDELPEAADEAHWATFVADAESAISREHTSWLGRQRAHEARRPT